MTKLLLANFLVANFLQEKILSGAGVAWARIVMEPQRLRQELGMF